MVAAMTMTFKGMLCYCVRSWVCACVDVSFPLGFSHLVCLYVCLCVSRGGGGGLLGSMRW